MDRERKLTPRSSDAADQFGFSVDLAPDRAAIGAPGDQQNGDSTGAAYIFEFDRGAWSETARLVASDGEDFDDFGGAVALSGDSMVIGAPEADPLGTSSGAAYLFEFDGSAWSEIVEFLPPEGAAGARFGGSVSLDDTRALIGASTDDINGFNSGTAFIAEFDGTDWQVTARLEAADNDIGDRFGRAVALEGNRALVSAHFNDDGGPQAGAVYVFEFNGTSWVETAKLVAADAEPEAYFGLSVDLSGDRALVGAYFDDSAGADAGAAYVFDFDGLNWAQTVKLTASDGSLGDQFGRQVRLDGDRALVSAPNDDDNGLESGSVYVFDRVGTTWTESEKLLPNDGASDDRFGLATDLSGGQAFIAAPQNDGIGLNSGAVYVFGLEGGSWSQTAKILPAAAGFRFGDSLDFDGARLVVGEPFESTLGSQAGAAYVFDFDGSTWQQSETLLAPDGVESDRFGTAVAVAADRVLVGAPNTDVRGLDSGSAYVLRLNRPPIARLDEIDGLEDVVLAGNVLADNGNGPDNDPDGGTLQVTTAGTVPTTGLGGDVVLMANGEFTYTPPSDLSGAAMFNYTVVDADGATATGSAVLRIRPVNDAPGFTTEAISPVLEDSGQTSIPRWATFSAGPPNEIQGVLQYSVSNISNPDLFSAFPSVDTSGALSFTPSTDAFGTSTFDLVVQDDGGTPNGGVDISPPQTFTITVLPVNDPPNFQGAGDVTGFEDTPFLDTWATGIVPGPLNESGQAVSFSTVVQANPGLFQDAPIVDEFGVLSFTPAPDALGLATVEVTAIDDGGTDNGGDPVGTRIQFNVDIREATDLNIDKTSGTTFIEPDGDVTYTIVVSNPGPSDVFQATVFDLPPPRLGDVTWTCTATVGASCPPSGTVEINDPVDLLEGTSVTFVLDARLLDDLYEPITNTARVLTPAGLVELNEADNIDRDTDRVGLFIDSFESGEP